jgi:antiviral helicase SKI2
MLAPYEPEEVVALLSCFLFQDKTEATPQIPDKLKAGQDEITKLADRVGRRQLANKVADPDFSAKLKFGLVEVVYEWARGMVGGVKKLTGRTPTKSLCSRLTRSPT